MKALIMNGAEDASLRTVEAALIGGLETRGFEVEALQMREIEMETCTGCFGCWIKTPGECVINDAGMGLAGRMITSDAVVYLTPITFGGFSYHLKKAIDRFIPNILPFFRFYEGEIHHPQRYPERPKLLACGVLEQQDSEQERMFAELNHRNALNMKPPGFAAAVVYRSDNEETVNEKIARMLNDAEVSNV